MKQEKDHDQSAREFKIEHVGPTAKKVNKVAVETLDVTPHSNKT